VTGVIVNEKLNVHRKYVKQVRMWIYYMEKYGPEKAEQLFRADYIREKGHVKNLSNPMFSILMGKLQYLKMVKGEQDSVYQKLKLRFDNVSTGPTKDNDENWVVKLLNFINSDFDMRKL